MTEPTLHLIHRHALPSGINVRGENAWLTSGLPEFGDLPRGIVSPYLVVALTSRYRRWGDDYYASLLTDIPPDRVIFVGVPGDLPHKVDVPGAYLLVSDFQQLARILSGAALVLGNPSFPYALAEGLKLPRMVELPASINVAPLDPSGIAMHLHTSDSLRGRIWQALNLSPPELTTLREELHCARDQMLRMLGERETIESERTTLESERTTLENERTTLENERTTLENERMTLENERMTLENERTTLESERTTLESERGEMRKRLDEARRVEAELRESLDTARKWALEYSDLENNFQILQASINKPGFLFKRLVWRVTCTHRAGRFLYSSLSRSQPLRRIWLRLDGVALSRPALSDIHTHQPISSRTEP